MHFQASHVGCQASVFYAHCKSNTRKIGMHYDQKEQANLSLFCVLNEAEKGRTMQNIMHVMHYLSIRVI